MPPLAVPPEHPPVPLPVVRDFEAVTLLRERAAAVDPDFAVTEDNRDAVVRLCARLDGVPLAIEPASTRLRTLSIGRLLQRLEDRFAVLSVGSRVAAPRQRTLRALVDWSYELCTPEQRRLWARLSIFRGGPCGRCGSRASGPRSTPGSRPPSRRPSGPPSSSQLGPGTPPGPASPAGSGRSPTSSRRG